MITLQAINPEYITDKDGNKKSVIISVEEFEELLEDLADLAAVAERKEEPTTPHNALLEELRKDGLL